MRAFILICVLLMTAGLVSGLLAGDSPATQMAQPPASEWKKIEGGPGERYAMDLLWDARGRKIWTGFGETNIFTDNKLDFNMHDDLWCFDIATGKWRQVEVQGQGPCKRAYQATCFDPKRNGIWLHGGFDAKFYNDLWFFDIAKLAWEQIKIDKDAAPSPRDGHLLVYDPKGDQLILFGGLLNFQKMTVSNELWTYDIAKKTWAKKKTGPKARFLPCCAFDEQGGKLYMQGGFTKGGKGADVALWIYDLATDKWESREEEGCGNFAAGRMVYIAQKNQLLIFGGGDTNTEYWYDLNNRTWVAAKNEAQADKRSYHGMTFDPMTGMLYVYGGTQGGFFGKCVSGEMWSAKVADPLMK